MGSEGQLGTGKSEDAAAPTPGVCVALGSHVPLSIAAGGQHTVLLVVSNGIITHVFPIGLYGLMMNEEGLLQYLMHIDLELPSILCIIT